MYNEDMKEGFIKDHLRSMIIQKNNFIWSTGLGI